jgi:hypothetical protein
MASLILEIELPPELFDVVSIQIPPNTKLGNIYVKVNSVKNPAAAFACGVLIGEILNEQTKNNIDGKKE